MSLRKIRFLIADSYTLLQCLRDKTVYRLTDSPRLFFIIQMARKITIIG